MHRAEDDVMDFGDDDDSEFLTGKLAALGIDEDLELSGGEEENDDPATLSKQSATAAASPPQSSSSHPDGGQDSPSALASARATSQAPPADSADGATVAVLPETTRKNPAQHPPRAEQTTPEEGELLAMIDKPLQASRGDPQGSRRAQSSSSGRKGGGRGKGRSPNNGRVRGRNVTIKECATWVCERLNEPKYYLMCQVVSAIGYNTTKRLLDQVRQTQESGGMPTADGTRKRSSGGVFFTLLKAHMEPAKLKALYADEIRVKKEKDRARRAANKRKAAAADAGEEVVMPPRNPPRGGRGSAAWRGMTNWAGPDVAAKRARGNQLPVDGGDESGSATTTAVTETRR